MIGPFGAGPKSDAKSKSRVKEWFREFFEIGEEASLMVTEFQCAEPGCPPVGTVIAVLAENDGNRQYKIHKPASEIVEEDVHKLIEGEKV